MVASAYLPVPPHPDSVTKEAIADELFWHIRKNYRSQGEFAEKIGVTQAMVSKVCRRKSPPTDAMLKDMGFERVVTYVRLRASQ